MCRAKAEEPGDIFSDAEATPRDERGSSPPPDPLADDGATAAADGGTGVPRHSPKLADGTRAQPGAGGAERTDGADEDRRLRLRQVKTPSSCLARLLYMGCRAVMLGLVARLTRSTMSGRGKTYSL